MCCGIFYVIYRFNIVSFRYFSHFLLVFVKIVLDTMPRLSRNFDDDEIMDFIDNYSSDNDVFLPDSDSEYSGSDTEV